MLSAVSLSILVAASPCIVLVDVCARDFPTELGRNPETLSSGTGLVYRVPPDPSLFQEQDSGWLFRRMSVEGAFVHVVIICHLQHQWQLLLVNVPHVTGSTFKSWQSWCSASAIHRQSLSGGTLPKVIKLRSGHLIRNLNHLAEPKDNLQIAFHSCFWNLTCGTWKRPRDWTLSTVWAVWGEGRLLLSLMPLESDEIVQVENSFCGTS